MPKAVSSVPDVRISLGTIDLVRKILLMVLAVAVVGAVAGTLWPATRWPASFCQPLIRVIGKDANAIVKDVGQNHNYNLPVSASLHEALVTDVLLAEHRAPTAQLRRELSHYAYELGTSPSVLQTTDAMSNFDSRGGTQLRACGIVSIRK